MPTIEVLDLVTQYEDTGSPDRVCYWTLPELFLPCCGERIMKFLDTESRPDGVLGNYYDALLQFGGPAGIRFALSLTHTDALKANSVDQSIRDSMLELLRLWFTEELKVQAGKPIKLWIKIGKESWKYKLVHG